MCFILNRIRTQTAHECWDLDLQGEGTAPLPISILTSSPFYSNKYFRHLKTRFSDTFIQKYPLNYKQRAGVFLRPLKEYHPACVAFKAVGTPLF